MVMTAEGGSSGGWRVAREVKRGIFGKKNSVLDIYQYFLKNKYNKIVDKHLINMSSKHTHNFRKYVFG